MSELPQKNIKEVKGGKLQEGQSEDLGAEDDQETIDDTKEKGEKYIAASVDMSALSVLINPETKGETISARSIDDILDVLHEEEARLQETGEYRYDYYYTQTVHALDDIVDGKEHDYSDFTETQKKLILLKFGKWANEGYDMGRKEDITSGEEISVEEFFNTMRQRKKLRYFVEKAIYDHLMKQDLTQGYVPLEEDRESPEAQKMIEFIANEFGIDEETVRQMWMESKNNEEFRVALNEQYFTSGVCRDIAVFQAKLAHQMGMKDTFTTNTSWRGNAHVVSGFRDEAGNIVFINYNTMVPTDTPNMKMALRYLEDNQESIALQYLMARGQDEGKKLIRIKSEASETIEDIARGTTRKIEEQMEDVIEAGKLHRTETGIDFALEKNRTNLELSLDTIAGSIMLSTTYHNLQDREANAINQAVSGRLGYEVGNEIIQAGVGTSIAHLELKAADPKGNRIKLNKFFVDLYLKAHKEFELTDSIHYQIGAIVDAIVDIGLDQGSFSSAEMEIATGQRLSYISNDLEVYVGLQTKHAPVPEAVQKSALNPSVYTMTNDLLAANLGVDIGLGTVSGYKLRLAAMGQVGTQFLGLAEEYKGKTRLSAEAEEGGGGAYIEGRAKYTDSHDFRIAEELEVEASAGYRTEAKGGMLEISGFVFNDVSLGEFKDPRLDDFGLGFKLKYEF